MSDQFNTDQNEATLRRVTQEAMGISPAVEPSTAIVPRPRDGNGRFLAKQKKSKAQKSTESIQRVMTEKDATGKTREERLVAHLLDTALTAGSKDLMSAAKAYEVTSARAWGKIRESEESLAALERQAVRVVILSDLSLTNQPPIPLEDLQKKAPRQPSFADAPFAERTPPTIEGIVVSTNPKELPETVKKPEAKIVECTCQVDSMLYCKVHRPY